jgi:hypothetical protein
MHTLQLPSLEVRRHDGSVKKLINEGEDPIKVSSEFVISYRANLKKAGTCNFLVDAIRQLVPVSFA